jgi:hypothetical protein
MPPLLTRRCPRRDHRPRRDEVRLAKGTCAPLLLLLALGCGDATPKREIVTTGSAEGEFVFSRGSCSHRREMGADELRSRCEIDALEIRVVGSPEKVLPCGSKEWKLTCPKGGVLFSSDVIGNTALQSVVSCEAVGTKNSSYQLNQIPAFTIRAECIKGPKPGSFGQ